MKSEQLHEMGADRSEISGNIFSDHREIMDKIENDERNELQAEFFKQKR